MTMFFSIMVVLGVLSIVDLREAWGEKKVEKMDPIQRYNYHKRHMSKALKRRLKVIYYTSYLVSEHWQLLRAAALYRDKYKCRGCGSKYNLQVHHRTYIRRGCERLSDVITICEACHREEHNLS